MNKCISLILISFLFTQCEKKYNSENQCKRNDWVGLFEGEGSCIGRTETIKLIFTKGSEPDEIVISNGKEEKLAKFENCIIQITEDTPFFTFPITGTAQLRGDSLDIKANTLFGLSCSTTIFRQ